MKLEQFLNQLERELIERHNECEDFAVTPSEILLLVINAIVSARLSMDEKEST